MSEYQFETRALIIKHAFTNERCHVDDDTVRAIAAVVVTDSIRELEGATIRVIAFASLTGQPLSPAFAEDVLAKIYVDGHLKIHVDGYAIELKSDAPR